MVGVHSVENIASSACACSEILWLAAHLDLTMAACLDLAMVAHSDPLGAYLVPVDELGSRSSHLGELREGYKN